MVCFAKGTHTHTGNNMLTMCDTVRRTTCPTRLRKLICLDNVLLSIFFVPYVLTAPFLGILGKIYGASRVLPLMMATFGSMTLLVVAVYNWSGLVALRWFLGMAESAFFPLVIYYQTQFYRRGELARRLAIFYAASNIAGAFGGLLAYGTFQIEGGSLPRWKYV